jgi:Predicted lipoprotein of unknown function (DUF2380)
LYGGGPELRLKQELLLGIGGGSATASPMLAFNIGTSAVSAATDFIPDISDTASDTGGSFYVGTVTIDGAEYYQFADVGGFTYEIPVDPKSIGSTYSPDAPAAPQTAQPHPTDTSSPLPPDPLTPPSDPLQTQQATSPTPPSDPLQTQQATPPTPPPVPSQTQQPNPAGSPTNTSPPETDTVPYDPMANSPLAKWLLYGNDTPIRDFVTNDSNLQIAQNVALGIAVGAATAATGGLLLDAAPAIGASAQSFFATAAAGAQSASASTAALATGASGIVAMNPGLPQELEELEEEVAGIVAVNPGLPQALEQLEEEAAGIVAVNPGLPQALNQLKEEAAGIVATNPGLPQELEQLEEEAEDVTPHLHHIFPQEFRELFEELGINIDQFAIKLDPGIHSMLHAYEWYNDQWEEFFEREGVTGQDAIYFATELLNYLGMAGHEYPVVPYK